ncbi:MAG: hypothetical protein ACSHXK_15560 [Oceanococcus sp.]
MVRIALWGFVVAVAMVLAGCATSTAQVADYLSLHADAKRAYYAGDCVAALEKYTQLVEFEVEQSEPWLHIGNCKARQDDYHGAIAAYRKATKINPQYSKAWYNQALLQATELARTMEYVLEYLNPDEPSAKKLRSLAVQVLAPFENGSHSEAEQDNDLPGVAEKINLRLAPAMDPLQRSLE